MSEHILNNSLMVLNEISRCRYGSVHIASDLKSRKVVAVKFVPTNVAPSVEREYLNKMGDRLDSSAIGKVSSVSLSSVFSCFFLLF